MTIFKDRTFTWYQTGALKISVLAFGLAIGAYWPDVFEPYATILLLIGIVFAIYVVIVSLKQ